jgi:hypothetical protein
MQKINSFYRKFFKARQIQEGARLAPLYSRYFSHEQIKQELQEAGFAVVCSSSTPYGHTVAKKK